MNSISPIRSDDIGWSLRLSQAAFAVTIFLSAFLLFQVQPLMAKYILPWFGGSPGVWTACLLFFQVVLLGGYGYAHVTSRHLAPRWQVVLHMVLLLAALAFLPIVPGSHWKPDAATEPTGRILLLLTVCLGLPYFMLSSTGPLLQAWFSRLYPGVVPYRLYALSNVGSLLALVSYPTFFERSFTRQAQAASWGWGFGGFVAFCSVCGWLLWQTKSAAAGSGNPTNTNEPGSGPERQAPALAHRLLWFGLPACASVLLLATTNKICQDVAVIPFLWVLPLTLYLLSFIVCFDSPKWYRRTLLQLLLLPTLGLLCYVLFSGHTLPLLTQIAVYCGSLLVCCLVCHGELYRLRPEPRLLTSFYLLIAAGGASGGVFVAVVAPLTFQSYAELNWGIWLLCALLFFVHLRERTVGTLGDRKFPLAPALLVVLIALGVTLVVQVEEEKTGAVFRGRDFYGALRVIELNRETPDRHAFQLKHGRITHGLQFTHPDLAAKPTAYYGETSGVGLVLRNFPRSADRRIGMVGLGIGTLAAYGKAGDTFRIYEINPQIKQLAETRFSYLKDSKATVEVVLGDARLCLEREPPQQFDLLVLDAFSGDAPPVHLLTKEAFAVYLRQLKPDGVIAVHTSNQYVDLFPVLLGISANYRLGMNHVGRGEGEAPWMIYASQWILLSRNERFLRSPAILPQSSLPEKPAGKVLWTDEYASLFSVLQ
ncbi:MAG: fused MFS/spermidine synthase [Verrucomicrobia bacterium]|nr:fused MFS/spermidine synthase [Verrucomicrobiota bacterium]